MWHYTMRWVMTDVSRHHGADVTLYHSVSDEWSIKTSQCCHYALPSDESLLQVQGTVVPSPSGSSSQRTAILLDCFKSKDDGTIILWNTENHSPTGTMPHPGRLKDTMHATVKTSNFHNKISWNQYTVMGNSNISTSAFYTVITALKHYMFIQEISLLTHPLAG